MAAAVFESIQNRVTMALKEKVRRGKSLRAWLDRVAYKKYQNLQRERWMTAGASQGIPWPSLNVTYAARKLKKFAQFPGGGTKMMIATNRLFNSVSGDNLQDHKKIVTDTTLEIYTTVEYASYADEARSFRKFTRQTYRDLAKDAGQYIMRGQT